MDPPPRGVSGSPPLTYNLTRPPSRHGHCDEMKCVTPPPVPQCPLAHAASGTFAAAPLSADTSPPPQLVLGHSTGSLTAEEFVIVTSAVYCSPAEAKGTKTDSVDSATDSPPSSCADAAARTAAAIAAASRPLENQALRRLFIPAETRRPFFTGRTPKKGGRWTYPLLSLVLLRARFLVPLRLVVMRLLSLPLPARSLLARALSSPAWLASPPPPSSSPRPRRRRRLTWSFGVLLAKLPPRSLLARDAPLLAASAVGSTGFPQPQGVAAVIAVAERPNRLLGRIQEHTNYVAQK